MERFYLLVKKNKLRKENTLKEEIVLEYRLLPKIHPPQNISPFQIFSALDLVFEFMQDGVQYIFFFMLKRNSDITQYN